ncbi:MAG: AarF/ABC1/UbiB kinase family protein [Betaproteobacteria bacterium]|nr:AarF/ABC1/UbiB kinase family protein [Betaproteobacteria bacterium]
MSLRPEHLKRYKDFAVLLWKYGRRDLVARAGLDELLPQEPDADMARVPEAKELARDVEKLGPTYIKLAQLLSTRPDIIPPAYAEALTRLQDNVELFPFSEVERTLEADLGVRLSKAFERIEPKPVAAASLAQVHYAVLRNGRPVALKVQRPGIREQVLDDLEALGEVASFLEEHTEFGRRFGITLLFQEFRKSMLRELDFRQEALHLVTIGNNLKDIPEIVIPQPVMTYTSSRVLTMEFIPGTKVTALSPLARLELDGERLADALFRAYLKQMLRDGLFHADPHPGNVFLVDGRIALIDLGMVARLRPALQDRLLQLLLAVSDNRPDDAAKVLLLIAEDREGADQAGFRRGVTEIVGQHQQVQLARPQVGRAVLMLLKVAAEHGIHLPPELAMIGKTLLNLDEIGLTLAPRFDTNAAVRRHAAAITQEQMTRDFSLGTFFSTAVELKNFVQHLPGRVNRILDRLADNDFQIKVDAIDEARLMEGMQKVANRIATGLVLAALIVGAALLMRVETTFHLFGYPGIAILLFLGAAIGGIGLVLTILVTDIRARRIRGQGRN